MIEPQDTCDVLIEKVSLREFRGMLQFDGNRAAARCSSSFLKDELSLRSRLCAEGDPFPANIDRVKPAFARWGERSREGDDPPACRFRREYERPLQTAGIGLDQFT